ncbi:alpha/beta fold hydrolase [Nocardia thailandica]
MTVLHAGGLTTTCLDVGEPGVREAVVFLHGAPGCAAEWQPLLARIGALGRAVAVDLPGFGSCRTPPGFDHHAAGGYLAFLDAAFAELGLDRVHLVCHGFGAAWGLAWAAYRPRRLGSLTTISAPPPPEHRPHPWARAWRIPLAGEIVQLATTRHTLRWALRRASPGANASGFADRLFADYDRHTRRTVLSVYRADRDPAMFDTAVAAHVPGLALYGARDPWLPHGFTRAETAARPHCHVEVLPELGHWPHADAPGTVAEQLVLFLRRHIRPTPDDVPAGSGYR